MSEKNMKNKDDGGECIESEGKMNGGKTKRDRRQEKSKEMKERIRGEKES